MTKAKRTGAPDSTVRDRILRAALRLIEQEGFDSVTAPRLAAEIGLRRPIIYYYFADVDQILLAAVRLAYGEIREAATQGLSAGSPTHTLWQIFSIAAAPLSELMARALRSAPFRLLYEDITVDMRTLFACAIQHERANAGLADGPDAASLAFLVQILSTAVAMEQRLGISIGHGDIRRILDRVLAPPHPGTPDPDTP